MHAKTARYASNAEILGKLVMPQVEGTAPAREVLTLQPGLFGRCQNLAERRMS